LTALTLEKSHPSPRLQARQILKKTNMARSITPLHLAACNPDPTAYLLFNGLVPIHSAIPDFFGRLPIHFAASSSSSKVLKYLIDHVRKACWGLSVGQS
jgi:hypothetical protein